METCKLCEREIAISVLDPYHGYICLQCAETLLSPPLDLADA